MQKYLSTLEKSPIEFGDRVKHSVLLRRRFGYVV